MRAAKISRWYSGEAKLAVECISRASWRSLSTSKSLHGKGNRKKKKLESMVMANRAPAPMPRGLPRHSSTQCVHGPVRGRPLQTTQGMRRSGQAL
jgi:hypothetical protein